MISQFDEVLIMKLQDSLREIELKLQSDFSKDKPRKKKDREESRLKLMSAIEAVMLGVVRSAGEGNSPILKLQNQRDWKNVSYGTRLELNPEGQTSSVHVKFDSKRSRAKFSLIVHLLGVMHRLLFTRSTSTRRELYYQNISLVSKQGLLDSAVRDICCLLKVPAWELGVTTTSKGLVAGPLTLLMESGDVIDCRIQGGVLIPQDIQNVARVESEARFVLLVEKDATFQKLLDEKMLERLGPCILVTGKGFPDVPTRLLIRQLWESLRVPVLALVDADPHGVEIMCVYRFGSLNMSHQSADLAVPALRWLGVHPSDISRLGIKAQPLTALDNNKLRNLATRPYITNNTALMNQMRTLHTIGKKAEIEGVSEFSSSYLTDVYIPNKICCRDVL